MAKTDSEQNIIGAASTASSSKRKRFIAGARCPACKAEDKTVLYQHQEASVRECVACGHKESLDALATQQELVTRVSSDKSAEKDSSAVAITIIDPKASH